MNSIYKYLISLLLLTALVSACSSTPTGRAQLTLKSEAVLAQEGARQMAIIREQAPLVQDRATIDFVACVADAIVGSLDGKDAAMTPIVGSIGVIAQLPNFNRMMDNQAKANHLQDVDTTGRKGISLLGDLGVIRVTGRAGRNRSH